MLKTTLVTAALLAMSSMLGCGAGVIEGDAERDPMAATDPTSGARDLRGPTGSSDPGAEGVPTPATADAGAPGDTGASEPDAAPAPPPPAATEAPPAPPPPPAKYVKHDVTFYGWADNSPPGAGIRYPKVHPTAGGTGTYDDPLTFATDAGEFAPGTILYLPYIEKYIVMEDSCTKCTSDWKAGVAHIDVWMTSSDSFPSALLSCENAWTRDGVSVEIDPPRGRKVTVAPLFDPKTGVCRKP